MRKYASTRDERVTDFVFAERIVVQKDCSGGETFCGKHSCQAIATDKAFCVLQPGGWVVFDFGRELHGGIDIVSGWLGEMEREILVSFGESVMETFSHPAHGHAVHEFRQKISSSAANACGDLGFRFVKLENVEDKPLPLRGLRGRFVHREMTRAAEFHCSDPLLSKIWETAVYTLELCMQDFVWDGIKRDRLVWMGDLYPEVITAASVFGKQPVIEKSMDFLRDSTPLPEVINGITSYSMWWILGHRAWFRHFGDTAYLQMQKGYLLELLDVFAGMVDEKGFFRPADDRLLIDWATGMTDQAVLRAGLHGLLCTTFAAGADLCAVLGEPAMASRCRELAGKMRQCPAELSFSTAGNAFQVLAGQCPAGVVYEKAYRGKLPDGLSTFLGCFPLDVCAGAGHRQEALDLIRQYWGGMLQTGATTFWEHFDVAWLKKGGRIDEFIPAGEYDIHGENGEGCFTGYRNSLCHGWSSLPAEWLLRQVCGIAPLNARTVRFAPDLCGLQEASCVWQSALGPVRVHLAKDQQTIEVPEGMEVVDCRGQNVMNALPDFEGNPL
ncbi:MAG: hypothetical protein IJV89_02550 [Lentisphaeria bacterium]|nr:hypothetical protein [Lentisphaeria bacterium]